MKLHLCKFCSFVTWSIVCLLPFTGYGQPVAAHTIQNAQWRQLTSDSAFSYRNEHEYISKPSGQGGFIVAILNAIIRFFASSFGHILIAIIALSVLGIIVYSILKSGHFTFSKEKKPTGAVQDEVDITVTNWDQLMQEAAKANDLRLAVRYGYMGLLQLLERKSLIQYRIDKTNHDYFTELANTPHKQPFRELSTQYEYAWYGHMPVSEADFNKYIDRFSTLKKQL